MKKHFLLATLLVASIFCSYAAEVKITMNAISTTMTLKNKATDAAVEVGEPVSKVYTFNAEAGTYILTGYDTDGTTVNGTIEFSVATDDIALKVFTITTYATNSGWVYGTDYTINYSAVSKIGEPIVTTLGDSKTAGRKTFMVFEGNTYFCDLVPTAAREGYATLYKTGTVNFNVNVTGAIPETQLVTITAPADASVFVGRKTAHFVSFVEEKPVSIEGTTRTYSLAKAAEYNYRVSKTGGLTQGGVFKADGTTLNFTDDDFAAKSPKWINHDVTSNGGYNVADIFLNINNQEHLKLTQGDTYDLLPLRNWEVVNSITANYFIEPDYHFTVTDLDGKKSDEVVTIDADGTLHAVSNGTAIVTVTYDAICLKGMAGGDYWSAIWPENTGVFVVTVGDADTGINLGMTINPTNTTNYKLAGTAYDADFDVFYFSDDSTNAYYAYTFKPTNVQSVKVAYPTIGENEATYSGFGTEGVNYNTATGEYTVNVKFGRQIVQLTNQAGVSEYQVLVGKPVHIEATAVGRQQTGTFRPGDEVKIQLSGLYHPANKLSGIHNFNATTVYYRNGSEMKSASNQYTFCSAPTAQAVSFSIPTDYDISVGNDTLTGGVIKVGGFGDPIGNHRNTSKQFGRGANFTAISQTAIFGALPEIVLPLQARPADKSLSFTANVSDYTLTVKDYKGNTLTATDGTYTVNTFDYTYLIEKKGYKSVAGSVSVTDASPADIVENVVMEAIAANDNGWDGLTTSYEPEQEDGVYLIANGYNLAWLAAQVNAGNLTLKAKQTYDISLDNYNWTPIGGTTASKAFKGEYDGQNNNIRGLKINSTTTYQALFGYVQNGTIKNLTVQGEVLTTGNYAAGIAAYLNASSMTNCVNEVAVTANQYVAGVAGYANGTTTIDRCVNKADITAVTNYAAGITANAMNANVVISNCYNTATIKGVNYVAGISANVQNANATIMNVFNVGRIIGTGANVGAIRGHATNGKYEHIYANQAYAIDATTTVPAVIYDDLTFAKGVVADSLGEAFGQKIGVDAYPQIQGMALYKHTLGEQTLYLNTENMPVAATATFENAAGGINLSPTVNAWIGANPETGGSDVWTSGDYALYTYHDISSWGTYHYAFVASNETKTTAIDYTEPYRSVAGGGHQSDNFAVWSSDYYGTNSITSTYPLPIKGFYVTNNAYTATVMAAGNQIGKKFDETDYLTLLCIGKLAGITTDTVKVNLAEYGKYIKDWTYIDLSPLGQVNQVMFQMEGSDSSYGYLNTPAYFCFDDFGAAVEPDYVKPEMASLSDVVIPTALEKEQSEVGVKKLLLNGQIYILRDGELFNLQGVRVK